MCSCVQLVASVWQEDRCKVDCLQMALQVTQIIFMQFLTICVLFWPACKHNLSPTKQQHTHNMCAVAAPCQVQQPVKHETGQVRSSSKTDAMLTIGGHLMVFDPLMEGSAASQRPTQKDAPPTPQQQVTTCVVLSAPFFCVTAQAHKPPGSQFSSSIKVTFFNERVFCF